MENVPQVIDAHDVEVFNPDYQIENGSMAADALVKMVKRAGLSKNFGGD